LLVVKVSLKDKKWLGLTDWANPNRIFNVSCDCCATQSYAL